MSENDWESIYPEQINTDSEANASPRRSQRKRGSPLRPVAVRRKADKKLFSLGDYVLMESGSRRDLEDDGVPHVGIIYDFSFNSKGFIEVRTVWFMRPEHTSIAREDTIDGEIYFTANEDRNSVTALIDTCDILSIFEYRKAGSLKEDQFLVRRGYEMNKGYTDEVDWDHLFIKTDLEGSLERIQTALEQSIKEMDLSKSTGKRSGITNISDDEPEPVIVIDDDIPRKRARKDNIDLISDKPDLPPTPSKGKHTPKKRGPKANKNAPVISTDILSNKPDLSKKSNQKDNESADRIEDISDSNDADSDEEFKAAHSDPEADEEEEFKPEKPAPATPRKRRIVNFPSTPTGRTPKSSPRKNKSPIKDFLRTPTRKIVIKPPRASSTLPTRLLDLGIEGNNLFSQHQAARNKLHVSIVPDSLPCRENEFSQIFLALESAINAETGSCIYVSGTPGTGKTATVREVISQLQLRCEEGELPEFAFLEINGMKLINPQEAYETLWEEISGQRISSSNAVTLLEKEFKNPNTERVPVLVLMDEMDQLVTKSQGVMYNFFNWPTFKNSKLIVVAVANTMDLPERMLSNKISSRLGLTRIQFPGYTHDQLREIIESRLLDISGEIVERDAIEFASRKVASVSGDARRALDICRRAVEISEIEARESGDKEAKVKISHIKKAIDETTHSPVFLYLQELPLACKVFLSAVLARVRRSGVIENPLGDILEETHRICKLSQRADKLMDIFYGGGQIRMNGFLKAVTELVEGGVLIQQNSKGERIGKIRLTIAEEEIMTAFKNDKDVEGMF